MSQSIISDLYKPILYVIFLIIIFILNCWLAIFSQNLNLTMLSAWLAISVAALTIERKNLLNLLYILTSLILIYFYNDAIFLLIFWEILGILGVVMVFKDAPNQTFIYLILHIASGVLMLASIALANHNMLILCLSIIINCALPPFHLWVTKIYHRLSLSRLLILASFTTKIAMLVKFNCIDHQYIMSIPYIFYGKYICMTVIFLSIIWCENLLQMLSYLLIWKMIHLFFIAESSLLITSLTSSILCQALLYFVAYYKNSLLIKTSAMKKKFAEIILFATFVVILKLPNHHVDFLTIDCYFFINCVIAVKILHFFYKKDSAINNICATKYHFFTLIYLFLVMLICVASQHLLLLPSQISQILFINFLYILAAIFCYMILVYLVRIMNSLWRYTNDCLMNCFNNTLDFLPKNKLSSVINYNSLTNLGYYIKNFAHLMAGQNIIIGGSLMILIIILLIINIL